MADHHIGYNPAAALLLRHLPRWLLLLLALCAWAEAPLVLRTAGQISTAPKYVTQGNKVTGICPALWAALQAKDGNMQIVGLDNLLSTPLIEKGLESGRVEIFCALLKTPARLVHMRYLEPSIYHIQLRAMARREGMVPVRDIDDLRIKSHTTPIIATAGLASTRTLMDLGIRVDASSSDNVNSLRRLQAGRGNYYFGSDENLHALLSSEQADDWAVILPTVFGDEPMHLVVSKHLSPEAVRRVQRALDQLVASGEVKQIVTDMKKQYGGQ